jgi:hypothetical protein
MKTLIQKMIGASQLDGTTYETVEADPHSSAEAVLIVFFASIAAAVGIGVTDLAGMIGVTIAGLGTWLVWVGLTYVLGTGVFAASETQSSIAEFIRTTGFSATPGLLCIFGLLPIIGKFIFAAATLWTLFAFVVAVRHALDFSSAGRAVTVCLIGWSIHAVLFVAFVRVAI